MLTIHKKGVIIKLVIQSNGVGLVCPIAKKTAKNRAKKALKPFKIKRFSDLKYINSYSDAIECVIRTKGDMKSKKSAISCLMILFNFIKFLLIGGAL